MKHDESSSTVFSTPFWVVRRELHDGREHFIIEMHPSVLVIPIRDDGNIVLISNYRCAHSQEILEFPGGGVEPCESTTDAAARELHEETGFRARHLRELTVIRPATSLTTELCHVFVAEGLTRQDLPAEGEKGTVLILAPRLVQERLRTYGGDAVALAAWAIFSSRRT